ncbi:trehalase-like domain-containing protein [Sulfobacillus thermosulfidooxidans]|uniref:trehalase-like domain-containing protein n=1 Tax=Sulfobacillus thermosulfidooxidans TaxID=28034 RepID=UPI0002EA2F3E|nr:trehalase-like domain-containing protein [Sulfobacillus thermosulfidooxidans]
MAWTHEKLEKPRTGFWPINQYMALGDMRTSALIGPDGSVDWLCLPQFDSGSVFGRILDKDGGAFELTAVEPAEVWRRYWPHTNVIETRVNTRQGTWIIRDWMSYDSVSPRLNRRIRVIRGVPIFGYQLNSVPNMA